MVSNILINILDNSNNITTTNFTNILNQVYLLDDSLNIIISTNLTPDISFNQLIENSINNILEIPNSYNTQVQEQELSSRRGFRSRLMSTLFPTHTQSEPSYPNNNFLEFFINSTFDDTKKYKKVIHNNEFAKIKKRKFNTSNDKNIICPIYMTNFTDDKEVTELPCGHIFEPEGIDKWLKEESNTCPVCRYEFEYKEITINPELEDNDEQDEPPSPITRSRSNLIYISDYLSDSNTISQIINQAIEQDMNYYIPDPLIENELNYDEEIELQRILLENPQPPT
jgi:hypothetical protein